jgi:hypothetical protein
MLVFIEYAEVIVLARRDRFSQEINWWLIKFLPSPFLESIRRTSMHLLMVSGAIFVCCDEHQLNLLVEIGRVYFLELFRIRMSQGTPNLLLT